MKKGTRFIGILLIFVSVAALFTWEKWGKNELLYEEIPVLTENVPKGTVISRDMVKTIKFDVSEYDCLKKTDVDYLFGREAAFFIHKGVPLFKEYFEQPGLTPVREDGSFILSIPDDWQISVPKTLAKGDRAYFFSAGRFVTSALVSFVSEEGEGLEVVVTDKQTAALSKIAESGGKMVVVYN